MRLLTSKTETSWRSGDLLRRRESSSVERMSRSVSCVIPKTSHNLTDRYYLSSKWQENVRSQRASGLKILNEPACYRIECKERTQVLVEYHIILPRTTCITSLPSIGGYGDTKPYAKTTFPPFKIQDIVSFIHSQSR